MLKYAEHPATSLDPFHVHRCPTNYICCTFFNQPECHLTPHDALLLSERLAHYAHQVIKEPDYPHSVAGLKTH